MHRKYFNQIASLRGFQEGEASYTEIWEGCDIPTFSQAFLRVDPQRGLTDEERQRLVQEITLPFIQERGLEGVFEEMGHDLEEFGLGGGF